MNLGTLSDLYLHMEWADASVWSAVLALDRARDDRKLRELLYHLHLVQRVFLRVWRGESTDAPEPLFEDTEAILLWCRPYYSEAAVHLEALGNKSLSEPMPLPWAERLVKRLGRRPEISTVGETALQVVLHSQYHRGQINSRLREIGGEPPLVDYIAWVWVGRPAPSWPTPCR